MGIELREERCEKKGRKGNHGEKGGRILGWKSRDGNWCSELGPVVGMDQAGWFWVRSSVVGCWLGEQK